MKRSYLYLSISLFLTLVLIIYHQLGGFREFEINIEPGAEYLVAGNSFEGKITGKEWEKLFIDTRDKIAKGIMPGTLAIFWYKEPELEEDQIKAYIGVIINKETPVPEGMEIRSFKIKKIIRATVIAHPLVMPKPDHVIRKMKIFAKQKNIELQDLVIELYPEESKVITEIPVK